MAAPDSSRCLLGDQVGESALQRPVATQRQVQVGADQTITVASPTCEHSSLSTFEGIEVMTIEKRVQVGRIKGFRRVSSVREGRYLGVFSVARGELEADFTQTGVDPTQLATQLHQARFGVPVIIQVVEDDSALQAPINAAVQTAREK